MRVVPHGKTAWLRQSGGSWQRLPVPADVGEPSAIIGGELDAEGLLRSFARLSDFSNELEGVDLGKLGVDLGEIKATLTVSERTHLLTSALVTTSMRVGEEKLDVRLTYRLTAANEAVRIPVVPGGTAS